MMAITGTGTELYPYVVHNYDELKEACEYYNYDTDYGTNYVKLANDIDCNDYGSDWVWETITLVSTATSTKHWASLDLDGHTIKNAYIKTGQYCMFTADTVGGQYKGFIKNGKILNVFCNASNGFFKLLSLDNISFSGNYANILWTSPFNGCGVYNSAIYAESQNPGSGKKVFAGSPTRIDNSDIEIHIDNNNNNAITFMQRGTNETVVLSNSRITGDITGIVEITTSDAKVITNIFPTNCVFELDINGYTLKDTLSSTTALGNCPTCVINDAKLLPWMTVGTTIAAPNDQTMRSASALNALGFTVVPRE